MIQFENSSNSRFMNALSDIPETFPYPEEVKEKIDLLRNAKSIDEFNGFTELDFDRLYHSLQEIHEKTREEFNLAYSLLRGVEPLPMSRRFF